MLTNVVGLMLFLMLFPVVVILVGALASTNCTRVRTRDVRGVRMNGLIARKTLGIMPSDRLRIGYDFAIEQRYIGRLIGWQAWKARRQGHGDVRFVFLMKRILSYINAARESFEVIVIDCSH